MIVSRATVAVALLLSMLSASGAASSATESPAHRCKAGFRHALIASKHTCLKAGQRCNSRRDAQYHRYGFHCHGGRLTRPTSTVSTRKVDVGGYRLSITCRGSGTPTVILESGFGTPGNAWFRVEPSLARTTRVCSYDRAGLGNSDPRRPAGPAPAAKVIEELHALLTNARIAPPYVLGGWSFGGFFIRFYAKRFPTEVVGLVTVDGTPAGLPPGRPDIDLVAGDRESFHMAAADAEVAASPGLGSRPLIVLTRGVAEASPADEALWLRLQKQVARLSNSSMLVRARDAGHSIAERAPELTGEAFRQVVIAARAGAALPACSATRLPRLGGTCLDANAD